MSRLRFMIPVDETEQPYSSTNPMQVVMSGIVDTNNTTTTLLGAGETYTGIMTDVLDYANACVNVHADEASAVNGLTVEKSIDGVDWIYIDEMTILANAAKEFSYGLTSKYLRVTYTNGATPQAHFDLSVILKKTNQKPSSHRIQDTIVDDDDAELTKSVITGKTPSGAFLNANVTNDGNLSISDNSSGLAIAEGLVSGKAFVHKFGSAPDFDTSDGEVNIWDAADDSQEDLMQYTYSTTADIDRISSNNAGDTVEMEIQGLDTDYNLVTQTAVLTGQTPVALTTTLIRVFRMKNIGSTDLVGRAYCFVNTTTTGGVPDTLTNIRAVTNDGNNQTEMALYTVPAGKTAYMRNWYASSAGAKKATNIIIKVKARPFGQVFQLKHRMAFDGSIPYRHEYMEPEVFTEKADIVITAELAATAVTEAAVSAGFDLVLVDN